MVSVLARAIVFPQNRVTLTKRKRKKSDMACMRHRAMLSGSWTKTQIGQDVPEKAQEEQRVDDVRNRDEQKEKGYHGAVTRS